MSLKPLKECPICGSTSGKCREHDTPGQYLCMGFADARKGDVISGFICTGRTKNSQWAMFALDNSRDYSREQHEAWAAQRAERRQKQQDEAKFVAEQSLALKERDRLYRLLLGELTLSSDDRKDLKSRGFSDTEIDLCGYKSVEKYQRLQQKYSDLLPGVASDGRKLLVFDEGYLLPVRNQDGLIVACQVRLRKAVDGNRYRWLTSRTKINPKGQSPHIHNKGFSELPLAIHKPEGQPQGIALVEGTGVKPFLASRRLNMIVLGAAGGQWGSSPNLFKDELDAISSECGTKEITLFPDAGDTVNAPVLSRWKELSQLLLDWGYSPKFAWWGQTTKLDLDIDELPESQYSLIEYLEPDPFFKMVSGDNGQIRFDWVRDWLKFRKFTPNVVVNQPEFKFPEVPKNDCIVAVKSGLGTGKTSALIDMIKASGRNRAIILGYRNNLLLQTIARAKAEGITIYHLQIDDAGCLVADEDTLLAFCLDSSHHMDGYYNDCDIYIDEACSVVLHAAVGGTLKEQQGKIIAIMNRALKVCNRVFLLDGNLNDGVVDFIAKLAPNKKVVKVENTAKIPPHNFVFANSIDADGELKKKDKSPLIKGMLCDGVVPFIASDSLKLTKELHQILAKAGKRGYVLNSETISEPWAKEFLDSPDNFIEKHRPDYFIISPSAESGVSITIKDYFTEKFTFFHGVQGTNSQHQMLFRLRDNLIPHYVFCPQKTYCRDRNTPKTYSERKFEELRSSYAIQSAMLAANGNENIFEIMLKAMSKTDRDWLDYTTKLSVIDNREMDNLRKCLIFALREAGHSVEEVNAEQDIASKALLEDAREEVIQQHALELFKSDPYESLEKANQVAKGNPGKEIQRKIELTRLLDRLPEIEESKLWNQDFIADYYLKDKEFIRQQQAYYMLTHFDISQKRSEINWFYRATGDHFFLGQFADPHQKLWALQQLNVLQFMSGEWHKDSPQVLELMKEVRNNKDIARALNCEIPNETVDRRENIKFVGQLLASIGLRFGKARKELINGVSTRIYSINQKVVENPARLAVLECLARKFDNYLESEAAKKAKWEEYSPVVPESQPQLPESQPDTEAQIPDELLNEWLSPDNIEYLNECLALCQEKEELDRLRRAAPPKALAVASRTLPREQKDQIRRWIQGDS
jgi:hypothetical protein